MGHGWRKEHPERYGAVDQTTTERVREWRKANPERANHLRVVERATLKADPVRWAKKKAAIKAFHTANPNYERAWKYVKKYGITLAQYDAMHAVQSGLCKTCGKPETAIIKGKLAWLSVDHNHATGIVRGLLCAKCNKAVGLLGDSPVVAQAIADYLT